MTEVPELCSAQLLPHLCPCAQCGTLREVGWVAEDRLGPGSHLVALLLNVQLHSTIFSLRIKIQQFSLSRRE